MSKFWRKHEKKLMKGMGLRPTPGSGNTWIEKEDGESELFLAQSKATKKKSMTLKVEDIKLLYNNAAILDKTPIFVISFVDKFDEYKLVAFDYHDAMKFISLAHSLESEDE